MVLCFNPISYICSLFSYSCKKNDLMRKEILLCIGLCLCVPFGISAQSKAEKKFERAVAMMAKTEYDKAEKLLLDIISDHDDFQPAYLALGEMYYAEKSFEKAKGMLLEVERIDDKYDFNAYMKLSDIYSREEKYDSAIVYLEKYLSLVPDSERYAERREEALHLISCFRFRIEALDNPVEFNPKNMGPNINSENNEYLPTMTADRSELLITRQILFNDGRQPEEDFYMSVRTEDEWGNARKVFDVLNSENNEGAGCISPDGRFIYFTRCYVQDGLGSCDIYVSERLDDKWGEPRNLGKNVNSPYWDAQPSIASDGRTLFFVSNREGGYGQSDIYYSYLQDNGEWTKAKNCGKVINTKGKELSPFIHPSNGRLYFASDYHCGMGGMDIFYSVLDNGRFVSVENMGYPINTSADETSLVVSPLGDYAIYASEREGGYGGLDLYAFELYDKARPVAVTYMKGTVRDRETGKAVKARLQVRDLSTGRIATESVSDSVNGHYLICLPIGKQYALAAQSPSYMFHSENFSLEGHNPEQAFEKDLELVPIVVGNSVVLKNIFYATDSYELLESSFVELNTLVRLLEENPTLSIVVEGHTDNQGSEQYNMTLSEKRAGAVVDYLKEKGIESARLQAKGYGFSRPLETNDTEEGRAKNRRTEIKITGK